MCYVSRILLECSLLALNRGTDIFVVMLKLLNFIIVMHYA